MTMPCDEPISPCSEVSDALLPYHAARVVGQDPSVAEFVLHWWPLPAPGATTSPAEGN